jgi:RNA recognition motif-containing protein
VGGISWETVEETLYAHFGQYGEVVEAVLMTNKVGGCVGGARWWRRC